MAFSCLVLKSKLKENSMQLINKVKSLVIYVIDLKTRICVCSEQISFKSAIKQKISIIGMNQFHIYKL